MNLAQDIADSLHSGFIDGSSISLEEYQPRLLINDNKRGQKVLTCLIDELRLCEEFYFSVAFITNSGVATLINTLKELEEKGVKGKIIASQYQNFTDPLALTRLGLLTNIELKIVTEGNFHAKGYIFKKKWTYSLIVGSSNLTQNALSMNKEWNIKVSSSDAGNLIINTLHEFDETFKYATKVDESWISEYQKIYDANRLMDRTSYESSDISVGAAGTEIFNIKVISPNKMQVEALFALNGLRVEGKNKALLISATGTGKTFLSAFDAKKYDPKRLLFVIHRENIAIAAMRSYQAVFRGTKTMGVLSGHDRAVDMDFIFSTIQTLSKDNTLYNFPKDHFDYIVIDEVHRSGAETYRKIIEHFTPKFLLGMSATPERTDGYDIYKTFDYNIAYEIRLNRALEENMLVPFHYYGVSDIEVDGVILDDNADFNKLVCNERVEKVKYFSKLYGCDKGRVKGLVFCSRKEESKRLSQEFNNFGFRTISLDGDSSMELREKSISRLEQENEYGALEYIFTVDIFNEGVDIPKINQIIMLRPTQSAIIFIQQLGRGLRKSEGKEYLTVIDFIGNYANNYLVPIALYGDSSYNKDNIRKLINSGSSYIPGASTVNFDSITKEKIFESINVSNLSKHKELVKDYRLLKYKLGRIPEMFDFIEHGSRDPYAYIMYAGTYYNFICNPEESIRGQLTASENKVLEFYSREICNAKRIEEMLLLKRLIENGEIPINAFIEEVNSLYGYIPTEKTLASVVSSLNADFLKPQDQIKYTLKSSVILHNDRLIISPQLHNVNGNEHFKHYLLDTLKYAIHKFDSTYVQDKYYDGFLLYNKYSRKDVCRILNWEKDESATVYGYRIKYNTCPIFVTYEKSDDINQGTKYNDHFINRRQFSWMTRNNVRTNSIEVVKIKNYKEAGLRIPLFVKKSDGEGTDFYYMGNMDPYGFEQDAIENHVGKKLPIVNIKFKMQVPVDDNMFSYLEG